MSYEDVALASNIRPARKGEGTRLTISTTARSYDVRNLKLGRQSAPLDGDVVADKVYVRLIAETATVYYHFAADSTITLDKSFASSEAGSAGTDAASDDKVGEPIAAGTFIDVEIDRLSDKFLHVQGSAAGFLTVRPVSPIGF